nr:alpha-ketoglutarate-dependent dioxygenase alkB homolog 6-like isoform X2 [Lytechinus pictus]
MDISSASEGGMSLNEYRVKNVYTAPKPKWTQLSNRRLQNWGGLPHPKGMIAEEVPKWLDVYANKIAELGVFGDHIPNHVLVNEYQSGQGIMVNKVREKDCS